MGQGLWEASGTYPAKLNPSTSPGPFLHRICAKRPKLFPLRSPAHNDYVIITLFFSHFFPDKLTSIYLNSVEDTFNNHVDGIIFFFKFAHMLHTNNGRLQVIARRARPTRPPLRRAAYSKISAYATLATKGTPHKIENAQVIVGHQQHFGYYNQGPKGWDKFPFAVFPCVCNREERISVPHSPPPPHPLPALEKCLVDFSIVFGRVSKMRFKWITWHFWSVTLQ